MWKNMPRDGQGVSLFVAFMLKNKNAFESQEGKVS